MPVSSNDSNIWMDSEGMDVKIKPGTEVKGTEEQRPRSSGGYILMYLNVPNAFQDETHLTFSPVEAWMVYAASLVTLSYLPSSAERLKQNRPQLTPKSNCKTNLRKTDEPTSSSQPSPTPETSETPSLLLNCQGRNPTPSQQLLPCICTPEPSVLAAPWELHF